MECLEFLKYGIICLCENKNFLNFIMSLESWRNEGTYLAFSVVIMDTWTHDPKIKLKKKKRPPMMMTSAFQLRV